MLFQLKSLQNPTENESKHTADRSWSIVVPKKSPKVDKSRVNDLSFESLGESCVAPKYFINVIYDQNGASQVPSVYNPNLTSLYAPSGPPFPTSWSEASFSESTFPSHDQTLDSRTRYHTTLLKGQRLITRYFKKLRRSKEGPSLKERPLPSSDPIDILKETVHRFLAPYRRMQFTFRHRHFYLLNLYNCLITIDIYLNLLVHLKMNETDGSEKRPRLDDSSISELQDESENRLEKDSPDDNKKKKDRKIPLLTETKEEVDEKDLGKTYAFVFFFL